MTGGTWHDHARGRVGRAETAWRSALILVCLALLLVTGIGAVALRNDATRLVYGASSRAHHGHPAPRGLRAAARGGRGRRRHLAARPARLGGHFRLDALGAFFLVVVNLGGAAASLYGLGYGRHERAPRGCCRSTRHSSPA